MRAARSSWVFGTLAIAAGVGCTRGAPEPGEAPAPCDGQVVLMVHNRTTVEIEIVEMRSNTAGVVVAFLTPGTHSVAIETARPAQYAARAPGQKGWLTWEGQRRSRGDRRVTLERRCEGDRE